jgi:hypothetical protein
VSQTLTSPFALRRLWHRSNPVGFTLRRHSHYVIASRRAQVLTGQVPSASHARAMPVALAVANEEINGVLRARLAVRYVVLTEHA